MAAPMADAGDLNPDGFEAVLCPEVRMQGEFWQVGGVVPSVNIPDTARIYIRVNGGMCYEAFPVTREDGREGFSMLLTREQLAGGGDLFEIYVE